MSKILHTIRKIPEGYSQGRYKHRKYGVTKKSFNNNRSFKIYAEALGGNDFVSLNYYCTSSVGVLKPCEMPVEKVIDFLNKLELE